MDVHLIDGTYELFRHYYAVPSARDREGREVGAVRGVLGSLLGMMTVGTTHIGVATDHVIEKFGIPPASIPDYLALVGDSSDGYPGLAGWGARSTSAVLAKYGHIESIPADWTSWSVNASRPAALAATLARDRSNALLFRDLATLRTDIALFDTVDQLRWNGPTPAFQSPAARLDAAKRA